MIFERQNAGHWARRRPFDHEWALMQVAQNRDDSSFCYHVTVDIEEVVAGTATGDYEDYGVMVMSPSWPSVEWEHFRSHMLVPREEGERLSLVAMPAVWFQETWDLDAVLERIDQICVDVSPSPDYDTMYARLSRSLDCFSGDIADARENSALGLPPPGSPPPWADEILKLPTSEER